MPRNIRPRSGESCSGRNEPQQENKRRKCDRTIIEPSESVLWPETEDSFFTDAKLDKLLSGPAAPVGNKNNTFYNSSDDSLFSDIVLPFESETGNVGATPIVPILPTSNNGILGDDTLFSEINIEQLVAEESGKKGEDKFVSSSVAPEVDLFKDDDFPLDELLVQCTQKFLADVAFKMPKPPGAKATSAITKKEEATVDCAIMGGTQYQTREEIHNRTMQVLHQTHIMKEIENVSRIDWESQIFEAEMVEDYPCKGDFYGLPDKVKRMIFETKGINSLYEWQNECLNLPAIRQRKNLIYALPTSGGKTLVAEILMLREVICREKNVLFILPYVSIVQEKVSAMSPFAINLDFIVEEYTAGKGRCPPVARRKRKSIFIASIEKGSVLFDSLIEAQRANEIGLVVVDELHLIGERGRGATLEAFLTKIMYLNAKIQIVGMSATIGNLSEISQFLKADVYTRGFRPVELKEYIKCGKDILQINLEGKSLEEIFVYNRSVNFNYSEAVLRSDPDHLAGLVTECAPKNGCLIFCSSRKNCENVAILLSRVLPKSKFLEYRKSEKADLMDALDKICGILSPALAKTIPYGIAYHHSGLTTDERKFIEAAYRFGVLSVICCTSTLAAGVNLPAKRVIIRAPYVGQEFMTLCKYKQMVGRAGRAGMGEAGESILISSSRDNVRVGEMLFSPMDKAISSLDDQGRVGLQSLILSAIGMGLASCRADLHRLVQGTLLAVQATQLQGVSVTTMVKEILCEMFKNKVLQLANNAAKKDVSHILITQDLQNKSSSIMPDRTIKLHNTTCFQLTTIGKAAFKAGIDYKRAYAIHNELANAQKQLILTNYAHILYLVVSFNSNAIGDELFPADPSILFNSYEKLDESTQRLFKQLGFTEAHAAKMAKTMSIQGAMELKLNRLYKVLILMDLLHLMPIPEVAAKYNIERGMLQNLTSQATAAASAIVRLCEQVEEFWCFKPLFERISKKMDRCGTAELEPLLELPAVKMNRARQLYTAGYKTIEDIAKCRPMDLVKAIEHMPLRIAKEIISAAKIILMKKLDHLEEETEALKVCLKPQDDYQSENVA
ncbi:helicase POLQ-like [Stomoxys calcitrans]|uniref:helicase POLQ-like n=1 Tax=Stomoxys calcitrans TaxID=35570 RepID=UPI0027E397AC|nr:helicase POLQ-like [Stomoxys calcitrans]